MADFFYGIDRGETEFKVAEGAVSQAKDVEVNIDLAVELKKSEVILALEMIINHILKGKFPPA